MRKVLDAHALMAFLEKEPGYEVVKAMFVSAVEKDEPLLMTSVNFGEVYYVVLRECGTEKAKDIERVVESLPVEIVDVDLGLAKEAAGIKAKKKMSYADCFAAALAKIRKCEIVTGDREFAALEKELKIVWLSE
ncbi:MAG: type II toxin-antitoxin system VapC family toxin [Candidatus Aminicenantes bacterium]|nr:type II toxin-antitoxin system VapC family toxin [Candidatus Aminicenantes bacterium]